MNPRTIGRNSLEKAKLEDVHRALLMLCMMHDNEPNPTRKMQHANMIMILGCYRASILREHEIISQPPARRVLSVTAPWLQSNFNALFRFTSDHIIPLMTELHFPADICLDNGCWVIGQEAFLVTLRFLAYPTRLVDIEQLTGIHKSIVCRILNYTMDFLYENHGNRVRNSLDWNVQYMESSKRAILQRKIKLFETEFQCGDEHLYDHHSPFRNICGYFDGFRIQICAPSDRVEAVGDGATIHLNIQGLVYSGYTKVGINVYCFIYGM